MKRVNYGVINAKYRQIGKGNVRLTQSSLFLRKPINPTVTSYQFDVLETQTATLQNDEIRLNINDEFIVTQMGLYLTGDVSISREGVVTVLKGLNLFTHALQNLDFVKGAELIPFYDGALKIAVNNIVYMEKWDTRKHYIAPRTQYVNASTTNVLGATIASNDFGKDGMYSVEPMITLSGAKKNDLTLTLPQALNQSTFTFVDDAQTVSINVTGIALMLRGLNAQNAASFQ
jgi:hypothetical protein